ALFLLRGLGQVLLAGLVGGVRVEVSDHPLRAGGRYVLLVEQSGPVRLARVGVELACEESATYSQGTGSVTSTKTGFTAPGLDPGRGWFGGQEPVRLAVPAGVMHSFEAPHNCVGWLVLVRGRALGLPYRRSFPVVILPE